MLSTPPEMIRLVQYRDGNGVIISTGSEVMGELKLCPECSGEKPVQQIMYGHSSSVQAYEPAERMHNTLASVAVENLLQRADQASRKVSKRAQRDFEAAYPLLKGYEQSGGGI